MEERGGATVTHVEIKWEAVHSLTHTHKKSPTQKRSHFTVHRPGRKVCPGLSKVAPAACYFRLSADPGLSAVGWWWDSHIKEWVGDLLLLESLQKRRLCWNPAGGNCEQVTFTHRVKSVALVSVCAFRPGTSRLSRAADTPCPHSQRRMLWIIFVVTRYTSA